VVGPTELGTGILEVPPQREREAKESSARTGKEEIHNTTARRVREGTTGSNSGKNATLVQQKRGEKESAKKKKHTEQKMSHEKKWTVAPTSDIKSS